MLNEVLDQSREQADRSSPSVRVVARLRIARVQSASDLEQARSTFEKALDEIRSFSSFEHEVLFDQAQQMAAAIAPDLLGELPPVRSFRGEDQAESLLRIMLDHGHTAAASDYVVRCDVDLGFPFGSAASLMQKLDGKARLTVIRRAVEAWRWQNQDEDGVDQPTHLFSSFMPLFQHHWKLLPPEEALAVVREIVRRELDRPDVRISASYPDFEITSNREHVLFQVLHIIRHLDPALAESLIASHAQVAAAAQRYYNGIETMHQEMERQAEERRKQVAASGGGGAFIMGGDPRDFPRQIKQMQAEQKGDFNPPIDHALELYREDIDPKNPNEALKAFWPSTSDIRGILYRAGKSVGKGAVSLLDRIPDRDLRLFAQIEFAAALAGLPAWQETSMKRGRLPAQRTR
jgi:hypothetical protein